MVEAAFCFNNEGTTGSQDNPQTIENLSYNCTNVNTLLTFNEEAQRLRRVG